MQQFGLLVVYMCHVCLKMNECLRKEVLLILGYRSFSLLCVGSIASNVSRDRLFSTAHWLRTASR